jgi:Copper amine oxidase N-terminal domain.
MKKLSKVILSISLLCLPVTAFASDSIYKYGVDINGKAVNMDVTPIEQNDRILVPFRAIAESLGIEVTWDEATNTVTAVKNGKKIVFTINSNVALVDGKQVVLDAPAIILNDRTMVPVRFLAESLGADVKWDADNFKVVIATKAEEQKPVPTPTVTPQPSATPAPATTPVVAVPSQSSSSQSSDTQKQKLLAEIVAKYEAQLTSVRESGISQLEAMISSAKAEFYALPKEQQTTENKMSIVNGYTSKVIELEANITSQVNSILAQMTAELQSNGLSTDVVQQAQQNYETQKNAKYAELLQKLNN